MVLLCYAIDALIVKFPCNQGKDKDATIYEHLVDESSSEWVHWQNRVPEWKYPPGGARFSQLVIPTLDSVRFEHLLGLVHSVKKVGSVSHQQLTQYSTESLAGLLSFHICFHR